MFLGVCAGFGQYFNIDPVMIRVIAVVITLCTGVFPGVAAYFIIALIVPSEGSVATTPEQSFKENVADIQNSSANLGQNIRSSFENPAPAEASPSASRNKAQTTGLMILGVVLICLGMFFILENILHWFWKFILPAALVLSGLIIIAAVVIKRR